MSHSTTTAEFLIRWWNFTDAGVWGRAISARRVEAKFVDSGETDYVDSLGLPALISTPLPEVASTSSSGEISTESSNEDSGSKTLLDVWLKTVSDHADLDEFAAEIYGPTSVYEVILESGKVFWADLAALCSIRLAAVLMRRPNPLFYLPATGGRKRKTDCSSMVFDPRFLLPIPQASKYRRALLATDQILVSKHHLFLFGNYLPELVGKAVVDDAPLSIAHARVHQPVSLLSDPSLAAGSDSKTSTEIATIPAVRFVLLGVARVLKSVLSGSLQYGNIHHRLISSFVGPWSSRSVFGRHEYRDLKRLSRRGLVPR